MPKTVVTNKERLLRAIRCLQLLQRLNPPKSSIAKAAVKSLAPLLEEMEKLPADAEPLTPAPGTP
jgi:hypothetical protein